MWIEKILISLFQASLRLYPHPFRQDFGTEMAEVFKEALVVARRHGAQSMIGFIGRELSSLPGSVVQEYWMMWGEPEGGMGNNHKTQTVIDHTWMRPPVPWRQAFLAAAPFILFWALEGLPKLVLHPGIFPSDSKLFQSLMFAMLLLFVGCLIIALVKAARKGWPLWSASWYLFFWILAFLPLGWFVSLVIPRDLQIQLQEVFLYFLLPLAVAVTLYRVTRSDRLRGLLAALPILYFLWLPNFEQTPRHIIPLSLELWVKTLGTGLLTLTIVAVLRQRDWRKGIWIILGTQAVVGLLFSYVGIYHGGTLPFSAPGPSLLEVVRSFIPQYLAVCAIFLGPFFARKFREIGCRSRMAGKLGYRLALLSLLVVITTNLLGIMFGMNSTPGVTKNNNETILASVISLALLGYLAGLVLLFWDAVRTHHRPKLVEIILLPILPLVIPITFVMPFGSWRWPISNLYGIPLIWEIPGPVVLTAGLVWLFVSAWMITRKKDNLSALRALPHMG